MKWWAPIVAGIALIQASPSVLADQVAIPFSYTVPTPDGRHVFVMLSSVYGPDEGAAALEEEGTDAYRKELAMELQRVRKTYTQSGLYRNDGSSTPLWTVDWYGFEIEPLSDAVHLVKHGPWASGDGTEALSFYANGVLLRSYAVRDLVALPGKMPHTVSHFDWRAGSHLDETRGRYWLLTNHWEEYVFDVRTGAIVLQSSPIRRSLAAAIAVIIGGLGLFLWQWRKRSRTPGHG